MGTLLTRGYLTGSCFLGAIFGTGTNGAYVEDISSITKLKKKDAKNHDKMVINTEWGAFDNAVSQSHGRYRVQLIVICSDMYFQ